MGTGKLGAGTGKLRVALLGAGWAAQNRHLPAMRAHGGFEVAAVADVDGERAAVVGKRFGVPHFRARAASELPVELDALACATPPPSHPEIVADAVAGGLHVLCDKPLALTAAECKRLADAAADARVSLCVMHNFQFARSALRVRRWLDEGRLGATRAVWAVQLSNPRRRLPEWFDDLPLGLLSDESPNLIALARAFAGGELEPLAAGVFPPAGGRPTPAQADVHARAGDVPVSIHMSFESPVSEWHVVVLGEEALASVDLFRDVAILIPNDGRHGAPQVARTSLAATVRHWAGYLRSGAGHLRGSLRYGADEVYRRFHAVATGAAASAPGVEAADALAVARVQDWIAERAT